MPLTVIRSCLQCEADFMPSNLSQYCPPCRQLRRKETQRRARERDRAANRLARIAAGRYPSGYSDIK